MKAKDLINILEKNPEAEVVYNDNEQIHNFVKVTSTETFDKGSCAEIMNLLSQKMKLLKLM